MCLTLTTVEFAKLILKQTWSPHLRRNPETVKGFSGDGGPATEA